MNHKFEKRAKRIYAMLSCFVMVAVMTVCPAFAADDPLAVVTNLSDFIFSLIRAIGLILLGFGVLQLGLSLKSHDPPSAPTACSPSRAALLSRLPRRSSPSSPAEWAKREGAHSVLPLPSHTEVMHNGKWKLDR